METSAVSFYTVLRYQKPTVAACLVKYQSYQNLTQSMLKLNTYKPRSTYTPPIDGLLAFHVDFPERGNLLPYFY